MSRYQIEREIKKAMFETFQENMRRQYDIPFMVRQELIQQYRRGLRY